MIDTEHDVHTTVNTNRVAGKQEEADEDRQRREARQEQARQDEEAAARSRREERCGCSDRHTCMAG